MKKKRIEKREIDGETWIKFNSEYDEFTYYWGIYLTILLIVILLFGGGLLFWYMYTNLELIKANPFVYGADRMHGQVFCDCFETRESGKVFGFQFNDTDWWGIPEPLKPQIFGRK